MFHHITLVRLKSEATATQIDAAVEALRELPGRIAAIHSYVVERNAAINPGTFDLVIVAAFADVDAYRAYQSDPIHKQAGAEYLVPLAAEFASIQYSH
jgi:hypothetical protein